MSNLNNQGLIGFPKLNLPVSKIRLKYYGTVLKIFDCIRNKFVALTPEEYVRQQFTLWLINFKGFPKSLMANEVSLDLNGTKRRCDSVVFNSDGSILMIVEFKAPDIEISQNVFDQIMRYNLVLKAKLLIVSNGLSHYCCLPNYSTGCNCFLDNIPDYITAKEFD